VAAKEHPDVFVVLKEGDSYGVKDGTPLCVDIDEGEARYRKIGHCVRYVPASQLHEEQRLADALVDAVRSEWAASPSLQNSVRVAATVDAILQRRRST